MNEALITPDQLTRWVPGKLTVRSPTTGWRGISVRGYRYEGSDVEVPPFADYLVVAYRRGSTAMHRELEGRWSSVNVGPGDVSLLTRAETSHWVWPQRLDVVHIYLTEDELASTCREMYEQEIAGIELHDTLRAEDPTLHATAMQIAREAAMSDTGSRLVVDALAVAMSVRILRSHAHIRLRADIPGSGLTPTQIQRLNDRIRDQLSDDLSLQELADTVGLTRYHFARVFKRTFGVAPHQYVTQRRIERAKLLLRRTGLPIREIAADCGFSDQSHLTRIFSRYVGVTPGRYRSR